uniref:Uncharacterized protein n=1 Tax=Toxoplasma gondii COUG TaxID=1074873 RepID=A0A2G8Y6R0_TOXGO|nr:hypothetical protein TGCOUG_228230 [Toxoplasma gondii COUG]
MDKLNLLSLHVPPIYGERQFPDGEALAKPFEFPSTTWSLKGEASQISVAEGAAPADDPSSDASSSTLDAKVLSVQLSPACTADTQMASPESIAAPALGAECGDGASLLASPLLPPLCSASAAPLALPSPLPAPVVDPGEPQGVEPPVEADCRVGSAAAVAAPSAPVKSEELASEDVLLTENKGEASGDAASVLVCCAVSDANSQEETFASSEAQPPVPVDGAVTPTTRFSTEQDEEGGAAAGVASACAPSVSSLLAACLPRSSGATSLDLALPPGVASSRDPLLSSFLAAGSEEAFLSREAVAALTARDASSLVSDPVAGHALTSLALLRGVKDSLSPAAAEAAASAQKELQRLLELQHEQQRQRGVLVKEEENGAVGNSFLGALEEAIWRQETDDAAAAPFTEKAAVDNRPAGREDSAGGGPRNARMRERNSGAGGGEDELEEDPALVASLRELLETLPRKKEGDARMLLLGEKPFVRPYARQIVEMWKIHLGETGRTTLKKEISERTQADATLKRRVLCIAKLKMATLEELVQIAEITGLLERTLQIANKYEAERQAAPVSRQNVSRRALSLVCSRGASAPGPQAAPAPAASQNFLSLASRRDSPVPSLGSLSPSLIFDPSLLSACPSFPNPGVSSCFSTSASSRRSPSPGPATAGSAAPPSGREETKESAELARLLSSASVNLCDPTAGPLQWPKGEGLLLGDALTNPLKAGSGDSSGGLSASSALFDLGDSELSAADATAAAANLLSIITQQQARSRPASDGSRVDPALAGVGTSATEELLLAAFGGDEAAAAVVAALASGGAAEPQLPETPALEPAAGFARKSRKRSRKRKGSGGAQATAGGESGGSGSSKRVLVGPDMGAALGEEDAKAHVEEAVEYAALGTEQGTGAQAALCQVEQEETGERGAGAPSSPLLTLLEKSLGGCREQSNRGNNLALSPLPEAKKDEVDLERQEKGEIMLTVEASVSSPDLFSACAKTTSEAAEFLFDEEDGAGCERRKTGLIDSERSGAQASDSVATRAPAEPKEDGRDTLTHAVTTSAGSAHDSLRSFLVATTRDSDADSRSTTSSRCFGLGASGAGAASEVRCRGEEAGSEGRCPHGEPLATLRASEGPAGEATGAGGASSRASSESFSREETGEGCGLRAVVGCALRRVAGATDLSSQDIIRDPFAEACAREAHDLLDRATRANLVLGITPSSGGEDLVTGGSRVCRKRSREDGDLDLRPTLQILSTVCVMYLKENLRFLTTEAEELR